MRRPKDKPIVLVTGLPRSGTSLMMQMLEAGGIPAALGRFPSYEGRSPSDWTPEDYRRACGKCLKLLDPLGVGAVPPRNMSYACLMMRRNIGEQAKSNAKFLYHSTGVAMTSDDIYRTRAQLAQDEQALLSFLRPYGSLRLKTVHFERLVAHTETAVRDVARFIRQQLGTKLDETAMWGRVFPRSPDCLGFILEETLIERSLSDAESD